MRNPDPAARCDSSDDEPADHAATRRTFVKAAGVTAVASPAAWAGTAAAAGGYGVVAYGAGGYGVGTESVSVAVVTLDAADVREQAAVLRGDLAELDGADGATVAFQLRAVGDGVWRRVGARSRSATGTYRSSLSGLDPGTRYEYRAVAEAADGTTDTGGVRQFTTAAGDEPPTITSLSAEEAWSPDVHATFTVDWAVRDADGDLDSIVVTVERADGTVAAWTQTAITGSAASGSDRLRVKFGGGTDYEVRVAVQDDAGNATSRTRYVVAT